MKLVIATHNAKKGGEMVTILSRRFPEWEFLTLADFPNAPEPEETGTTYQENAEIKARAAVASTGLLSIADDAGLEVDALEGAPGLYSKRFAGEDLPFNEKMALILSMLAGKSSEERAARFRCAVCVGVPSEWGTNCTHFEATCEGLIYDNQSGSGGFGYDPIFFLPELGCTMADLTAEQKHAISHRGKVLGKVGDWLETRYCNRSESR